MSNFFTVLKALFKNKLRFGDTTTKGKKIGFIVLIAVLYVTVVAVLISAYIGFNEMLGDSYMSVGMYFIGLLTVALIVLFFAVVNLVSTLYLSKDTDFFSMLPIKSSVVFAAKLSFVYISEAIIACAIMLPLIITIGVVSEMWFGFYIISIIALAIVPALPLVVAAIIAIPVMFIASKLKNRNIVALIFYIVLFGAFIAVYLYAIAKMTDFSNYDEETIMNFVEGFGKTVEVIMYIFYPYTALTQAACGVPSFGLGLAASTAVNLAIFFGISVALLAIAIVCARFMYSQAAKANNQTDNSKAVKREFKQSGLIKSIMKREYAGAMRTTQVAFQCFGVVIIPIMIALVMGIMSRNMSNVVTDTDELSPELATYMSMYIQRFFYLMGLCAFVILSGTLANASITTFSREGSAFATLKVLPATPKQIVKGKVCAWLCVALPAALVGIIILNAFMFDPLLFVLSTIIVLVMVVDHVLFGALWDLSAPKLKWTDAIQAVKHNGHATIGQLICMGGGLLSGIIMMMCLRSDLSIENLTLVCFVVLGVIAVGFAIADVIMLKSVDKYYNRIEI